jgi:histidinol dehydrogenase
MPRVVADPRMPHDIVAAVSRDGIMTMTAYDGRFIEASITDIQLSRSHVDAMRERMRSMAEELLVGTREIKVTDF